MPDHTSSNGSRLSAIDPNEYFNDSASDQTPSNSALIKSDKTVQVIVRTLGELKFKILFSAMRRGVENTAILMLGELLDRADESVWDDTGGLECSMLVRDLEKVLSRGRSCIYKVGKDLFHLGYLESKPSRGKGHVTTFCIIAPGEYVVKKDDGQSKKMDARAVLARAVITPCQIIARAQPGSAIEDPSSKKMDARAQLGSAMIGEKIAEILDARAQLGSAINADFADARAIEARAIGGMKNALNSTSTTTSSRTEDEDMTLISKGLDELYIEDPTKGRLLKLHSTTRRIVLAAKLCLEKRPAKKWVGLSVQRIRGDVAIEASFLKEADDVISGKPAAKIAKIDPDAQLAQAARAQFDAMTDGQLADQVESVLATMAAHHPDRARLIETKNKPRESVAWKSQIQLRLIEQGKNGGGL